MASSINVQVVLEDGAITYKVEGVTKTYAEVAPFFASEPKTKKDWIDTGETIETIVELHSNFVMFYVYVDERTNKFSNGETIPSSDRCWKEVTTYPYIELAIKSKMHGILDYRKSDTVRYIHGNGEDFEVTAWHDRYDESFVHQSRSWVDSATYRRQELQEVLDNISWNEYVIYDGHRYKRTSIEGTTAVFTMTTVALEQTHTNFKIYSGRPVSQDFLSSIRVVEKIDAEVIRVLSEALDIGKMGKTVMYDNDEYFDFLYDVSEFGLTTLPWHEENNLHYLVRDEHEEPIKDAIYLQKHYISGEIVPADTSDFSGGLLYDDNTIMPISELVSLGAVINKQCMQKVRAFRYQRPLT